MSEKQFKIGIIGAGVIADFHAQAIQAMSGAELVAAYARKESKAADFSSKYGCHAYSNLDNFLAHPELDIVTICSVSGVHLDHTLAAAKAGKHIICEKPLEINTDRIDQMIQICEENKVFYPGFSLVVLINRLLSSRKQSNRAGSEKSFYVILRSNGGGLRNITIVEPGEAHGI